MLKKILLLIILLVGLILPTIADEINSTAKGKITSVEYIDEQSPDNTNDTQTKQIVKVKILTGDFKGNEVSIDNMLTANPVYDILLSKGDKVILHFEPKADFIEDINDVSIFITDIERTNSIYLLVIIFFALLFLIGKKKGLLSFLSIVITISLIFFILTPMILHGINPIASSLLICILSTLTTIYLVSGFNYKSTSAILGTVLSLGLASLLSILTIKIATLTGFTDEESLFLYSTRPDLNFSGILSASMMLAALGAVMDVGVSIASTINEIYQTDKTLSIKNLFTSGMNVGKDIIGTMSNTLILVYLGSALPLVLLSNNIDLTKFFNLNQVATEISSALIGSIAILACVPITAIISAYLIKTKYEKLEKI